MSYLDHSCMLLAQGLRCDVLTVFFKIFIPLQVWIILAAVIAAYAAYRSGILLLPVVSFFTARFLSRISYEWAKNFFHRPRPYLSMHELVPVVTVKGYSFPSGHATLAMASAVVLARHFPKSGPVVYTLAVLTGFSRIYLGVHYPSDVLAGFVLGAFLGWLAINIEQAVLQLTRGVKMNAKTLMAVCLCCSCLLLAQNCQAKSDPEQNEIIALNDAAAAVEDSSPNLSKALTQLADDEEKDWEYKSAQKNPPPPAPLTAEDKHRLWLKMKVLTTATVAVNANYPLLAKSLRDMVKTIKKEIAGGA